jgi:hypothetical protein
MNLVKGKYGSSSRMRYALAAIGLLAIGFVRIPPSYAQKNVIEPSQPKNKAGATAVASQPRTPAASTTSNNPAVQQTAAPPLTESSGKASGEGINVHGHWTIEIRKPDGTLVSHREFENSLVVSAGSQVLSQLLAGQSIEERWLAQTVALRS